MVHIAQICIAILVISAVVSAAPCGNREPSVATYSDYNTPSSCDSFDDGKDRFVDNTKYVAVTEEAPCDDEVDGVSSEETNKSNSQANGLIVLSSGKNLIGDIILHKNLNNLLSRDVTQKKNNKSNSQANGLIVLSSGGDTLGDIILSKNLNNLLSRDVTQKKKNKSNSQLNSLIGVSSGGNTIGDITLDDNLNDALSGL
ncbi:hypothetical protein G6F57_006850 [Rhizopus arrhizus]|nr:hypothetical protein G6F24_008515 [Rhizopus arrhizus]KAG1399568.1 hypothetical protein G6F58_011109 [Rhizopus delemar]KAG0851035.1 hypothetical protein G6F17_009354 [Rhizopus arrhizus]KAG0908038.1 hypothetical protein G6F33_010051 [Rhizopus arrhizus]KAG0935970.1 hypothetical protein G6F30_009056 [Rhizopus arrhizus]